MERLSHTVGSFAKSITLEAGLIELIFDDSAEWVVGRRFLNHILKTRGVWEGMFGPSNGSGLAVFPVHRWLIANLRSPGRIDGIGSRVERPTCRRAWRCADTCSCQCGHAAFDQAAAGQKIIHDGEAIEIADLVENGQARIFADAGTESR
jgi:hypothetical protein